MKRTWTVVIALLVVGCSAGERPAPIATSTHRVVSLVPAVTEMLFAIGAGEAVVGVSSFDEYPADVTSLPRVGALLDPDFERILTLRPDLVVVYESQVELIARLERASIGLFRYRHAIDGGLDGIPGTMRALGARLGYEAPANGAADQVDRELAEVRSQAAGRPRPDTALVFGRESGELRGIYVSGGAGFLHELLTTAGGRNVFGDVTRENLQASVETMLARAPDVILELRTHAMAPAERDRELAVWGRLPSLPAVRNRRVYLLTDPALSIPGPRIGAAARAFLAVLHPDAAP